MTMSSMTPYGDQSGPCASTPGNLLSTDPLPHTPASAVVFSAVRPAAAAALRSVFAGFGVARQGLTGLRRLARRRGVRVGLSVCGLLLAVFTIAGAVDRDANPVELELFTLAPAPFQVTLETEGRVEPIRSERVISQCRWSTRILSIVPEGTWVQKGDVVCELDSSEIVKFLQTRDVPLIQSRAALDASVQDEELLKAANERRLTQAAFEFNKAEHDLAEYQQGTHPQELQRLQENLRVLEERLLVSEDEYQFTEKLWSQGLTSQRALDQARFDLHQMEETVRSERANMELLTRFRHPRSQLQMEFRRNNAEREVLRTEISNSLAATRARLSTLANERRVQIYQRYVDDARRSLEACTLRAPCDGQVLHANSWRDLSRGQRAIEEGKSVYYQQPIFQIPDERAQKVAVPLHEALITRVHRGMPVTVRLKGYENEEIAGEVVKISEYPLPRSRYSPDVLDYWLDVRLKPTAAQQELVRLNMDAAVTMSLAQLPDALTVPRDAVVASSGLSFVWLLQGADLVPRAVQLGEATDREVQVVAGLAAGDRIVVNMTAQQLAALQQHLYEQLSVAQR